jgi:pSer/pThr/pTyr-binding forkhead associated (FHA) protein
VFPLDARTRGDQRGWVIGRRRSLAVGLDYDPFVSQEHAEVLPVQGGFEVRDLETNKNGTSLNWEPLARGGSRLLEQGDVIGVGRTLLLFRER